MDFTVMSSVFNVVFSVAVVSIIIRFLTGTINLKDEEEEKKE